jgi:hypothetical protein
MKKLKFDSYDGVCFLNGLVFFAPVALLVECMSLIILSYSAVQMLAEPILGKLSDGKKRKVRQEKTARSYSRYSRGGFSSFWRDKIQGSRAASNADIAVAFKPPGISADGSGKSVCGRD